MSNFKIPIDDVEKIVSGAYLGPSSGALYPFELIVIDNINLIKLISYSVKEHKFIENASILIFVCQKNDTYDFLKNELLKNIYIKSNEGHLDSAIAGTYIDLIATSLGYNTIWMGYHNNKVGRKILNLPKNLDLLYYIAIGKTTKDKKKKFNTGFKNKTHYNTFGNNFYDKYKGCI